MSTKTKVLNVHADSPDLRDRIYNPTLRYLGKTHNARPFADRAWSSRIKDQSETSACTGFALAGLVEALVHHAQGNAKEKKADPISPFMLYFFARKYDEIPGDAVDEGSTARGAMKAWHKHGACRLSLWPHINTTIKRDGTKWIADAFKTPLGAYYRVDHTSIPDLHAALNETGVVYVTAQTHTGWDKVTGDATSRSTKNPKTPAGTPFSSSVTMRMASGSRTPGAKTGRTAVLPASPTPTGRPTGWTPGSGSSGSTSATSSTTSSSV